MPRDLASSLVHICREADVRELRVETVMGSNAMEVVEVWLESGVLRISIEPAKTSQ